MKLPAASCWRLKRRQIKMEIFIKKRYIFPSLLFATFASTVSVTTYTMQVSHEAQIKLFLDRNANKYSKSSYKHIALFLAVFKGNIKLARDLLKNEYNKSEINDIRHKGHSLLLLVITSEHYTNKKMRLRMINILLGYGFTPHAKNKNLPLYYAVVRGYRNIVKQLLLYGAKITEIIRNIPQRTMEIGCLLTNTREIHKLDISYLRTMPDFQDIAYHHNFYVKMAIIQALKAIQNNAISIKALRAIKCICESTNINTIGHAIKIATQAKQYERPIATVSIAGFKKFLDNIIGLQKKSRQKVFESFDKLCIILNYNLRAQNQYAHHHKDLQERVNYISNLFENNANKEALELRFLHKTFIIPKLFLRKK